VLRRATTIQGLSTAPETVIWRKHSSGIMGAHIWAPEIHFIDGKWYVYFAAGAGPTSGRSGCTSWSPLARTR
jgi:GH43 family beta-xylosidase